MERAPRRWERVHNAISRAISRRGCKAEGRMVAIVSTLRRTGHGVLLVGVLKEATECSAFTVDENDG